MSFKFNPFTGQLDYYEVASGFIPYTGANQNIDITGVTFTNGSTTLNTDGSMAFGNGAIVMGTPFGSGQVAGFAFDGSALFANGGAIVTNTGLIQCSGIADIGDLYVTGTANSFPYQLAIGDSTGLNAGNFIFDGINTGHYAYISMISNDVTGIYGGNTYFKMNPQDGLIFKYGSGTGVNFNATSGGIYIGANPIIKNDGTGNYIGTGMSQSLNIDCSSINSNGRHFFQAGSDIFPSISFLGNTQCGFSTNGTNITVFSNASAETWRSNATNLFGIGTGSTISAKLHVNATTNQFRVGYNSSNYYTINVGVAGAVTLDAVGSAASFTFADSVTLRAGTVTAGTHPLQFVSGALLTTPVVGVMEFLTDLPYITISTGTARKAFVIAEDTLVSGRVPYLTTNGRVTSTSVFLWSNTGGGRLSPNYITLAAGTTSTGTCPLVMTSGSLMTTPLAGGIEFLTDKFYGTIVTGIARKEFTLNDIALTSGRVPFATTNGRLTDDADFTFATDTLTVTKIAATTYTGTQTYTAVNLAFDTTTGSKIGTATTQKIGLWNATPIVQPTTGVASATVVPSVSTAVMVNDTYDGYTIAQVVKALRNIGALA
jgi:hypothetical protein